jgi:hypothetical protein
LAELDILVKAVFLGGKDMPTLYDELMKLPVQVYKHGKENIFDISPGHVDKWSGLQELDHDDLRRIATEHVPAEEEVVIAAIRQIRLAYMK